MSDQSVRSQRLDRLFPVHDRHLVVDDDDIRSTIPCHLQHLSAIGSLPDSKALILFALRNLIPYRVAAIYVPMAVGLFIMPFPFFHLQDIPER